MNRIVGVVPAGGRARRVHGFFKEMMPIGIDEDDRAKFVVSSERIIESMLTGGATSVHFILGSQKVFIGEYYAKQHLFEGRVNFNYLTEAVEDLGMPYTVESIYEQIRSFDYVMMGMPDTVIEPITSFSSLFTLLVEMNADLALGLYRTDSRNRGGFVRFDPKSKEVLSHVDKTQSGFPDNADNSWAIACWNGRFTKYIHEYLKGKALRRRRNRSPIEKELLFGDIIDAAIAAPPVHVVADFVEDDDGFYWDITEPEKYFDLLRHYSPGDTPPSLLPGLSLDSVRKVSSSRNRVFIGHGRSPCWEQLRDLLQDRLHLEWEEFNRIPAAGVSTQERLVEMVEAVGFAFVVMTAEEEREGGRLAARDNVIHEVGLFQGRLGFRRTVILLEDGCAEFSNILGLSQIRFPRGNLLAKSEEIRRVLEREGVINREV
jgi:hypothetical protein